MARRTTTRKAALACFATVGLICIAISYSKNFLQWPEPDAGLAHDHSAGRALLNSRADIRLQNISGLRTLTCTSCALVGTSGFLLAANAGKEIDSHECVFRLDFSPVRGYSDHVGVKTTVRVVDSHRLTPFLKHPEKLSSGLYASDYWYVFGHRVKESSFHERILEGFLLKEDNVRFEWFTKAEAMEVTESLRRLGGRHHYSLWGGGPTALWYAVKVIEDSGCEKVDVYGLPDPKMCKRIPALPVQSLYWDKRSPHLCRDGHDMGHSNNRTLVSSQAPSLAERRAMKLRSRERRTVDFHFPDWPSS